MTLKTPDALIGATSLLNGHTLFITNDAQLADALPDSNCIYLKDVALDWLSKRFPGECFSSHSPVNPLRRGPGLPNGTSLEREKARQLQPCFASKSDHQREADSWNGYLSLFRVFSKTLGLPQTSWLLCEDGVARTLDTDATIEFLDQAKNVLGWKEEQ